MSDTERLLLTPPEAAKALSIGERTLWTLTKSGEIVSVPIGRLVRYDPADLRAWIERKKVVIPTDKPAAAAA